MFRRHLITALLLLSIGIGVFVFFSLYHLYGRRAAPQPPGIANTAALLRQVELLSELVTVRYVIEKIVILEDVKWYGENRVLLVAHGVVKGGVDLGRMKPEDLKVVSNRVILRLPPATITDTYLDDSKTRVVERATGVLRAFDKDLEQEARRQAVDDIQRAARYSGILDDAREQAERQIRSWFGASGLEVEFE